GPAPRSQRRAATGAGARGGVYPGGRVGVGSRPRRPAARRRERAAPVASPLPDGAGGAAPPAPAPGGGPPALVGQAGRRRRAVESRRALHQHEREVAGALAVSEIGLRYAEAARGNRAAETGRLAGLAGLTHGPPAPGGTAPAGGRGRSRRRPGRL